MNLCLIKEPSRYLVIGAICAVLNNCILISGDAAGLHYAVSIMLTFVLVLPISYFAHTFWTFEAAVSWKAFGRFLLGSLLSLMVASVAVGVLRGGLNLPMSAAAPLATVAMTIYNFLMTRWAVTKRSAT